MGSNKPAPTHLDLQDLQNPKPPSPQAQGAKPAPPRPPCRICGAQVGRWRRRVYCSALCAMKGAGLKTWEAGPNPNTSHRRARARKAPPTTPGSAPVQKVSSDA